MPLNEKQQRLVEDNMGLVGQVIRDRVHGVNMIGMFTYDDIFQIGCLGLSKAAMRYMSGKAKFSTYAYVAIRNEIYDALDYATVRGKREVITDDSTVLSLRHVRDDLADSAIDLEHLLERTKERSCNMISKGIDAIRMMADGYTAREVGEIMGGVPAKNVTAWVSKARAHLKKDPTILAMR